MSVIPPLRARREDIAPLTVAFVEDVCQQFDKTLAGVSNELITTFEHYSWPGNVRQLRREVERLVALTPSGEPLSAQRCSPEIVARTDDYDVVAAGDLALPSRVKALEMKLISAALERTAGGKGKAAQLLGIPRQGLHKKLKRYSLG